MNQKYLIALSGTLVFFTALTAQTNTQIPRDTTYNVARVYRQIQKAYPYATPAEDKLPASVKEDRNIAYASFAHTPFGKRDLHLDIFRPGKEGKYPAVIMVHGGGWRSGDRSMQVPMAEMLASKGIVGIPVEYQLSLEAEYPAAIFNIKAAIRWVKAHAGRYNIDTSRVAVAGCSAGGQLAALVGLTNGVKRFEGTMGSQQSESSRVNAIIDIDGVISFLAPSSLNGQRKKDSPDVEWLGGTYFEKPEIWKEASAGYWATSKSVPMLFLNSGYSRFHAGQDELVGQLNEWGVYHEVHKFNIKVHPFWLFHPWVDEVINYMVDFLSKIDR